MTAEETTQRELIQDEFTRTAKTFAERTAGRFQNLNVVEFSRVKPASKVIEVGAGTGNFLSLFGDIASMLVAVDLTLAMLEVAVERNPKIIPVIGDGAALPFQDDQFELTTCAQMLHHVNDPVPLLREMARITSPDGNVLVVDQVVASDDEEMADAMTELELVRDPSHARSRTSLEFSGLLDQAGLMPIEDKIAMNEDRFSKWMSPDEFPERRVRAVRKFIEERGLQTGLAFRRDGDDFIYERRRIMILASPQ